MKLPKFKQLIFIKLIVVLVALSGCVEDFEDQEIYQRPDWLAGKLYEQISKQENLNTFISCLEKTGYDSLLNTSGSFTVIAPTDDAFTKFFSSHPLYNSVDDIPAEDLKALVEYQIIYNAWTREQFQSLDVAGWIDPESQSYNEPRGYKRQTVYQENNKAYPVVRDKGFFRITTDEEATSTKLGYTPFHKYVPIFFREYLNIYNLGSNDYEFYFNRAFDHKNLYYAGAIIDTEIPAENGFVYKSDQVVLPLPNAETILEEGVENHSYNTFLNLIHEFSELTTNFEATFNQPRAREGLDYDTLYNVRYPSLLFNIGNESTGSNPNLTIREHYGLLAPTDVAFNNFVNSYISEGWGSLAEVPDMIKEVIINTHMSDQAIYPKNFTAGIINGVEDRVYIDEESIIQKTYGSNCSFLGLNKVLIPRAFQSVARPVYLERGYDIMLHALEETKALSAIKDKDSEFSFFIPSDFEIGLEGGDSSLYVEYNADRTNFHFEAVNMGLNKTERISVNLLRKIILNQVGLRAPSGNAKKEFIENMGGNYIIFDNTTGIVSGTAQSTFGYKGDEAIDIIAEPYTEEVDNGKVYKVNAFFSFTNRSFWTLFSSKYRKFQDLMQKAGLYSQTYNNYPFMTRNELYTVFVPSDSVIEAHQLDTLAKEDLRKVLEYHFVKGALIFTDGHQMEDNYKTVLIDESDTDLSSESSTIHIRPTPDVIEILDKEGGVYLSIPEDENTTNIMTTIDTDEDSEMAYEDIVTGVVHEIDKLLIEDILYEN